MFFRGAYAAYLTMRVVLTDSTSVFDNPICSPAAHNKALSTLHMHICRFRLLTSVSSECLWDRWLCQCVDCLCRREAARRSTIAAASNDVKLQVEERAEEHDLCVTCFLSTMNM